MAKFCITENTATKNCKNCGHYKYDVDYGEFCCCAEPNDKGEVEWTEWIKLETDAADTKEKALEEDVKRALVDLFIDLDAEVKGGGGTHDMDKIEQAAEEVVLYVIYAARRNGIEV